MRLYPVILAGGLGTRLWPLSRRREPKPFLPLLGERTLYQETILRLEGLTDVAPLIVCNRDHGALALSQSQDIGKEVMSIVLEPEGRNTAPALTMAVHLLGELAAGEPEDPVFLMMPADGVIKGVDEFQAAVRSGVGAAERGFIVVFGVTPRLPHTGYGYIHKGKPLEDGEAPVGTPAPLEVRAFVEKPDLETAKAYLESGEYLWNSGVFLMRSSVWLEELERHRPDIAAACRRAHRGADKQGVYVIPDDAAFRDCPSQSIDYAVVERAAEGPGGRVAVAPLDAGWSDLGSWSQVWEESDSDAKGNVTRGQVYTESVEGSLIVAQDRVVAAVGLKDVVVVETRDAALVTSMAHAQDVGKIAARLARREGGKTESHPWGTSRVVDEGPGFRVKRLSVNPGAALPEGFPEGVETWVVVSGSVRIGGGAAARVLGSGESAAVGGQADGRVENAGAAPLEVVSVSASSQ